jgi:hypothetical protein
VEWEFSKEGAIKHSLAGIAHFKWDEGTRIREVNDGFVANFKNRDFVWVPRDALEQIEGFESVRRKIEGLSLPSAVVSNEMTEPQRESDCIINRYEMNQTEFLRSAKANFDFHLRWPRYLRFCGIPILLVGVWRLTVNPQEGIPICGIAVIATLYRWNMIRNAVEHFKIYGTKGHTEWHLSPKGISQTTLKGRAEMQWDRLKKGVETPEGFLLYKNSNDWFWLPLSGFASAVEISSARELLREKVSFRRAGKK